MVSHGLFNSEGTVVITGGGVIAEAFSGALAVYPPERSSSTTTTWSALLAGCRSVFSSPWRSTARVSKRLRRRGTVCLRARYCTTVTSLKTRPLFAAPPDRFRESPWETAGSTFLTGDQPRAPLISEIRPRPVEEHHEPIAESDQEEDVNNQPGHPRHKPLRCNLPISAIAALRRLSPCSFVEVSKSS